MKDRRSFLRACVIAVGAALAPALPRFDAFKRSAFQIGDVISLDDHGFPIHYSVDSGPMFGVVSRVNGDRLTILHAPLGPSSSIYVA